MPRNSFDQLHKLLPISATRLERDLLRITPFDAILQPAIPLINTSKRLAIPANWVPWLIVEYGLGRLQEVIAAVSVIRTPLVDESGNSILDEAGNPIYGTELGTMSPTDFIEQGLVFNRLIGTPGAIGMIFDWRGIEAVLVEEQEPGIHFAEFQVKLISSPPNDPEEICLLGKGLDIAKPARGRFRRIFNDAWDIGRFILDESDWGDLLDNYSGVYGPEIGLCNDRQLWVSLGQRVDMTPVPFTFEYEISSAVFSESVEIGHVGGPELPILDVEFDPPANFYDTAMSADMSLTTEEVEEGEEAFYRTADGGFYLTEDGGHYLVG